MKHLSCLFTFVLVLAVPFSFAAADTPSVSSVTASPGTVNSGQLVSFTWSVANGGGYSFIIPCISGVKIAYSNGTSFACGTRISSTLAVTDGLLLAISIGTGTSQIVHGRVIPKDASGQDMDALRQEATVTVAPLAEPIKSLAVSATSTISGVPLTLSWTSEVIDGVNLQLECRDEISVRAPVMMSSGGFLSCGTAAFSNPLLAQGSVALNFRNSSRGAVPYRLTIIPAITTVPPAYDGTHARSITIDVGSDTPGDPEVQSFIASSSAMAVDSGHEVPVSWSIKNAVGANLKISCIEEVTAISSLNASTTLPCSQLLFPDSLPAEGNLVFTFRNVGSIDRTVALTLIPSQTSGIYDEVRGRIVRLTVHPAQMNTVPPIPVPNVLGTSPIVVLPLQTASSSVPHAPVPESPSPKPFIFTRILQRGSSGLEVTRLQELLKRYPDLYPEGAIIGYFGPATERAVGRFQLKQKIIISQLRALGYGIIGARTRVALNRISSEQKR